MAGVEKVNYYSPSPLMEFKGLEQVSDYSNKVMQSPVCTNYDVTADTNAGTRAITRMMESGNTAFSGQGLWPCMPQTGYGDIPIPGFHPDIPGEETSTSKANGQYKRDMELTCPKVFRDQVRIDELLKNPAKRQEIEQAATDIRHAFKNRWVDDNELIKITLKNLAKDPTKLAALEIVYGEKFGAEDQLRKDIKKHLGFTSFRNVSNPIGWASCIKNAFTFSARNALDVLNQGAKVSPRVGAIALRNSMEDLGTDEKTVKDILGADQKSQNGNKLASKRLGRTELQEKEYISALSDYYSKRFGPIGATLVSDIRSDFSGTLKDKLTNIIIKSRNDAEIEQSRLEQEYQWGNVQ